MQEGFGDCLRRLRESRSVSGRRLASQVGLRPATLSDWETGRHQPRLPELEAVLTALGATAAQGREALALLRVPRAARRLRAEPERQGIETVLGPMPGGGDLLRALRHRRGLYLAQAAASLRVSSATLSRWEQGRIAPAPETLERLLTLLNATPQERSALAEGALFLIPPLCETGASVAALEALSSPFLWPNFFVESTRLVRYKDLVYLSLAAQAWRLAREPRALRLLSEIQANYANYLASQRRFAEAERRAHYALDLRPDRSAPESFHARAAILAARSSVHRGARPAPGRGIRMLQLWLPITSWPEYRAWMVSEMAEYYALDGDLDCALSLAGDACELARRGASAQEFFMRRLDLIKLLLRANRAAEALRVAQSTEGNDQPFEQAEMGLLCAEALWGLGDRSAVSEWLRRAYDDIDAYDLQPLRARADALAQRF
jgi:transcriptional regulator with XRE-family HTH domain